MHIEPFGVEIWMNEFETKCELNLAETCVESLTIAELLALVGRNDSDLRELLPMKMTYGAIEGSERLRDAIAALYARQQRENVIVTHGTIGANSLVHQALVSRGDHVISVIPTYQQHYSIPASIGAEVSHLLLREELGFLPDLEELEIAQRVAAAVAGIGARAVVTLVAADERMARFRHPAPTPARWRQRVMVVVCAKAFFTVATLPRLPKSGALLG